LEWFFNCILYPSTPLGVDDGEAKLFLVEMFFIKVISTSVEYDLHYWEEPLWVLP